jgi:hypothetical protein
MMVCLYCLQVFDPEATCRKLFQVCGYDVAFLPDALVAMNKDSQDGAIVKRKHR